jgi:hypothetical protein
MAKQTRDRRKEMKMYHKPVFFCGSYAVIAVISGYAVCESARIGDYDPYQDELYFFGALKDAVKKCRSLHRVDLAISTRMTVDGFPACSI